MVRVAVLAFVKNMLDYARGLVRACGFDVVRTRNQHGSVESHLANLLDTYEIDCVIDVGANVGQYGKMLRAIGYDGAIVSFEPVQKVFKRLLIETEDDLNWHCFQFALGEFNEEKTINVYSSTVFSSFLDANDYSKDIWKSLESGYQEQVQIRRLDEIYDELIAVLKPEAVMLKLDTQGFDHFVFRGAQGCIDHLLVLQSELSAIEVYDEMKGMAEMIEEYSEAGFTLSGLYPINRDESMAVIEFDSFFVRRPPRL